MFMIRSGLAVLLNKVILRVACTGTGVASITCMQIDNCACVVAEAWDPWPKGSVKINQYFVASIDGFIELTWPGYYT